MTLGEQTLSSTPSRKREGEVRGKLKPNAPLAPLVWFKSGGDAEWLFEPADEEDLVAFLKQLDRQVPVMALGLGSNMIVRDGGVAGVVVRLGKAFSKIDRLDEVTLRCGGGASGILVSSTARDAGIAGLEFLRGIPARSAASSALTAALWAGSGRTSGSAKVALRDGRSRVAGRDALATPIAIPFAEGGGPFCGLQWNGGRAGGDRGRDGRHRPGAGGVAAVAQPHRRLDVQESARPQGLGIDRRRRLPGHEPRRRASFGKTLQFPFEHRHRHL